MTTHTLPLYRSAVLAGDLLFVSGQLPVHDGSLIHPGRVGSEVTVDDAREAARLATHNCLRVARDFDGGAREVQSVVKLSGYVCVSTGFSDAPTVIDAASQVVNDEIGGADGHARLAIGVASLPRNACVEVEMVVRLAPSETPAAVGS
ncbi:RidA family protein [Rhodococcus sovatensis]|uniref:RidA family protein n=1 Tax=Rhodococcus sovatensis TaxID=1805840 RepID=A0ABZ2PIU2_9NOCA